MTREPIFVGIDVGSTTVKAVARRGHSPEIVWQDYQRHETRQAAKVREFISRMQYDIGLSAANTRLFMTGSGGGGLAPLLGGRFVQEVNAVSMEVEKSYPDVQSVVELGGQDAKILFFQDQPGTLAKKKIATMNDKCAGGTGAVLDKLSAKLHIPPDRLCLQRYRGLPVHRVAGKCGVFAETDINGLQKLGIPSDELMASLFEAIVLQNLTVLTRGQVLCPKVLLLGGPNTFIPGLREAWQAHIPKMWEERGVDVPIGLAVEELIFCPDNGHYFAALGALEYGYEQEPDSGWYKGLDDLDRYLEGGDGVHRATRGIAGLRGSDAELAAFTAAYTPPEFETPRFTGTVRAILGVDGGSTSTKAVLLDSEGELLAKSYCLSKGNPIQDTIGLVANLREQVERDGAKLEILGAATTGYAKNVLERILRADVALVETVAHARSAQQLCPDVDVIVDVGGQDIKLIALKDGRVKDFMLNTQCSAGNGYFLEATARSFGIDVCDYASNALQAQRMPEFSYGCAVFLQTDIISFQRKGWNSQEILAGLAAVLPKNIWLYVAKTPNLAALGTKFLLQGGTQRNLAAVKAQVDYIRSRFHSTTREPQIAVHRHTGEAGAIGAALEALRLLRTGRKTTFIGLDAVATIEFDSRTGEETRCRFCKNQCLRTFIDYRVTGQPDRLIVANCEKGATEDVHAVKGIMAGIESVKKANPNLLDYAAHTVFLPPTVESVIAEKAPLKRRTRLRIGIPRLFNQYLYAPFFSGYLQSLGVPRDQILFSDYTSNEMYREGATRGAVDPCFPSKVAIPHIHNLLYHHHKRAPLDVIFNPAFDILDTHLTKCQGQNACPTVIATPLTIGAAFRMETDVFADLGIRYMHPILNLSDRRVLAHQMFEAWGSLLGLTAEENEAAIGQGILARENWLARVRAEARSVLEMLERERRLGIVMLGRVYHHDPGLSHGIFEEFQKLGYPVFTQTTLPIDPDILEQVFHGDHPLDIDDVWKHSYSASTSHKIWAAKYVARHRNLIGVEVSNFKCGHDAPAYQTIERIIESAGRPYFSFKDLDENKPAGALKIRIETIHHFLTRQRDSLVG